MERQSGNDPAGDEHSVPSSDLRAMLAVALDENLAAATRAEGTRFDVPAEGRTFGPFELLEQIGRGGMGVIYRARKRSRDLIVALKVIAPALLSVAEARRRFDREILAAAALEHTNILKVYEVGEVDDIPYYSMMLAEGGTLATTLSGGAKTAPRDAAKLVAKIARAVDHAHGRGVLHRDLKPANILLDSAGEPLVADFGLAQLLLEAPSVDLTRTLIAIGTPGYIAPELLKGVSGPAADIYGLGAILFHLLSGRHPFEGADVLTVLKKASAGAPPSMRQLDPAIPKLLDEICTCLLQPNPAHRYASSGELATDLEHWLDKGTTLHLRKYRRAPRRKIIAAGLIALLLVGAAVWIRNNRGLFPPRRETSSAAARTEAEYFLARASATIAREHSEPNLRYAEQYLRSALKSDPASGAVHAELSRLLSKIFWHITQDQTTAQEAHSEAKVALHLAPQLAVSHVAMGEYLFRCQRDYAAALEWLDKAAALDPRMGSIPALRGIVLKRLGRWEEALQSNRRACELEPDSAPLFYDLAVTCDVMRRYAEATEAIERAEYLAPDNPGHTLLHAWLLFRGRGDVSGLESLAATLSFEQQVSPQYFDTVFLWLLWSHRPGEALHLAQGVPDDYAVRRYDAYLLKPYFVGLAQRAAGDEVGATASFETARQILESREQKFPEDARVHGQLGIIYAALGLPQDALRESRRAVELLPVSREPVGGSYVATQLAEVYARVGQIDEAVSMIADLLARPGHLTIHELKLDPRWESLQKSPRFQQLVADRTPER